MAPATPQAADRATPPGAAGSQACGWLAIPHRKKMARNIIAMHTGSFIKHGLSAPADWSPSWLRRGSRRRRRSSCRHRASQPDERPAVVVDPDKSPGHMPENAGMRSDAHAPMRRLRWCCWCWFWQVLLRSRAMKRNMEIGVRRNGPHVKPPASSHRRRVYFRRLADNTAGKIFKR